MNKILVINAGSSSIKWTLFNEKTMEDIASGLVERIGVDGAMEMKFNGKHSKMVDMKDHAEGITELLKFWNEHNVIDDISDVKTIGFRIVHGSTYFSQPIILDDDSINKIEESGKFAPLHNPGAVMAIKAFRKSMPHSKLTANFDTGFHSTIPAVNYTYPIEQKLALKLGIRKYGMHGISHRFITLKLEEILKKDKVSFVNMHIGNGASLCAVKDSKSYDTTMGLTPLAGLMMGTRSGDIDPSIHQFVMNTEKMSIDEFTKILNNESGLKGVSGVSADMRDVLDAAKEGNEQAKLALDLYTQRIVDYTSSFINKIEHVDALVFTAGIGENSAPVRKMIIDKLSFFDIKLDEKANENRDFDEYKLITTKDSKFPVYVVFTNEELMIAEDAKKL